MKKILVVAVVVAFTLVAGVAMAITGKHDFRAASGNTTNDTTGGMSTCQYCHTPHNALSGVANTPLWNRNLPASITAYGQTLNNTNIGSIGGNSQACMSCHDGATSLNTILVGGSRTFTGNVGGGGAMTGSAAIGVNLTNDHPVGFQITPGRAGLPAAIAGIPAAFKLYGVGGDVMECGTCHDPHDNTLGSYLRVAKGTICSDCHVSK